MRQFSHYLLLTIVLFTQAYWATAAIPDELTSATAGCEHLVKSGNQSGESLHQLCTDHDCHATAHNLAVVTTFALTTPAMTHSQIRTAIKHYLSYPEPPPIQPPRSLS